MTDEEVIDRVHMVIGELTDADVSWMLLYLDMRNKGLSDADALSAMKVVEEADESIS